MISPSQYSGFLVLGVPPPTIVAISPSLRCSQGILKSTDGKLFLIQDYTASPSSTAELILGGSKNGWDYWKDSNGISINELLR